MKSLSMTTCEDTIPERQNDETFVWVIACICFNYGLRCLQVWLIRCLPCKYEYAVMSCLCWNVFKHTGLSQVWYPIKKKTVTLQIKSNAFLHTNNCLKKRFFLFKCLVFFINHTVTFISSVWKLWWIGTIKTHWASSNWGIIVCCFANKVIQLHTQLKLPIKVNDPKTWLNNLSEDFSFLKMSLIESKWFTYISRQDMSRGH